MGIFVIIYVFAKETQKAMCSILAKIAIECQAALPQKNLQGLTAVQLSSMPNCNEPLLTINGYQSANKKTPSS